MKPERWTLIETICQNAMNLEPNERKSYLKRACDGDKELLTEVDSLLNYLDSDTLHRPIVSFQSSTLISNEETPEDRFIGPYRLIRTIATGGMGEVYLAIRNDDSFELYVALKVIKKGFLNEEVLARFYSERKILASLTHPNIARLFDGGETDDGHPWYAMEYAEGVPITTYCEQHKCTIEERIHLFLEICSAVQYAHQNLIVHRDIKPDNILITPDGKPKLLDFGIAKILDLEPKANLTQIQFRIMTPEYASPEQIKNEPISTVSDVYSLGVLFYEMLAGTLPLHLENRTAGAIEQIICEQVPEKPSAVSGSSQLSGDLDNIILKSLKKDPVERYSSVEQFAADIQRYLNGQPVIAQKDTLSYRAKKFVGRHRWSVAVASLFAILILAFGTISAIQSATIQARALEVEQERDRAEKISGFLTDLFASADPSEARNESISAVELLQRGAERAEHELTDQPGLQAELFMVIANVYESLGLYPEAEGLTRKALLLKRNMYGDMNPDIATSLNALGWILYQQGDYEQAELLLFDALKMRKDLYGSQHLDVSRTLNDLAVLKQAQGDYPATDSLLSEALQLRRELLGNNHEAVGVTLSNYAALKWRLGEMDSAEEMMREVLQILRSNAGDEDMRVPIVMTNLAALLMTNGDMEGAEQLYRDALAIRYQLVGDEHPDVAFSLAHLGNLLRAKGELDEAETLLKNSLEQRRKFLGSDHLLVGDSKRTLALLYTQKGDHDQAERYLQEALQLFHRIFPSGNTRTADLLHLLGELYLETDRAHLADPYFREAMEIRQDGFGDSHLRTLESMVKLGVSLAASGKTDEAKAILTSGHERLHNASGDTAALIELAANTLGDL